MKNGAGKKLTDFQVHNLKAGPKRYIEWEPHGLGVRVTPKGVKSFVFVYRFGGKLRMMTLRNEAGKITYPAITLAEARKAHRHAQDKLDKGVDPAAKAITEREAERKAPTVAGLVDQYIERWAKPRKKSWKVDLRILEKDVLPDWGQRKAKDITRRDVKALLSKVLDRGAPIGANRLLALLRKMFNYAVDELEIITTSPCLKIKAPAPENRRDRVFTTDEISAFWIGLDRAKMAEGTKLILKMQLVTGQRKGEIVSAAWEEIDLTDKWWTIPPEKAKNKMAHRVPLAPLALELLQAAESLSGSSPWVFPSPRTGKHITPEAVDHALRRPGLEALGFRFVPHDLRRTAASLMTGMGISRLVVSKILNHVERGITAVYDRHSYDLEKRQALEAWAHKLKNIVEETESNVVPMVRQA